MMKSWSASVTFSQLVQLKCFNLHTFCVLERHKGLLNENKCELNVNCNNEILPFCSESKYHGVKLERSLAYCRCVESLPKIYITRRPLGLSCWLGLGDGATTLGTATLEPWSIHQQITALPPGAVVFTSASSILPSTTPCELCQDACVLH